MLSGESRPNASGKPWRTCAVFVISGSELTWVHLFTSPSDLIYVPDGSVLDALFGHAANSHFSLARSSYSSNGLRYIVRTGLLRRSWRWRSGRNQDIHSIHFCIFTELLSDLVHMRFRNPSSFFVIAHRQFSYQAPFQRLFLYRVLLLYQSTSVLQKEFLWTDARKDKNMFRALLHQLWFSSFRTHASARVVVFSTSHSDRVGIGEREDCRNRRSFWVHRAFCSVALCAER